MSHYYRYGFKLLTSGSSLPQCPDIILQLLIAVASNVPSALTSLFGVYYKYLKILSFGSIKTESMGLDHDSILPAIVTPLAEHDISEFNCKNCHLFLAQV